MSVQVVNIGTEVILYNTIALSHTHAEAWALLQGNYQHFQKINKTSLHHELKQQKHNNKNNKSHR